VRFQRSISGQLRSRKAAPGHGRRHGLIKERHREIAEIEQPRLDVITLFQVSENPLRGFFRKAALACASNNNGNNSHAFAPGDSSREQRKFDEGHRLSPRRTLSRRN
jgi:hypothetical protein